MAATQLTITDIDDPRLAPYRSLKGNDAPKRHGLFIVEGTNLIERLIASDIELVSILVTERLAARYVDACKADADVDLLVADDAMLSQIVGFDFHRGVLACGKRPSACCPRFDNHNATDAIQSLAPANVLIACPLIHDPENLGLIVRTVAGLGVDGLLTADTGADVFARRCLRVSMGAAFSLPIIQSSNIETALQTLQREHGFQLIASTLKETSVPVATFQPADRFILLMGSEPEGLPPSISDQCDASIKLPMCRDVDSHNVAVATGMLLLDLMGKRASP